MGMKPAIGGAFYFKGGYGLRLNENIAAIFTPKGEDEKKSHYRMTRGRDENGKYKVSLAALPKNTTAVFEENIPLDVDLAMKALRLVVESL